MNLEHFLTRVLPTEGQYFAGTATNQKPFNTIQGAIGELTEVTAQHNNAYVAIGSFREGGTRQAPDSTLKRSFYVDLDCGDGKEFTDKPHAIKSCVAFCTASSIPLPTIFLDSGNGVHAYWTLKEAIPSASWKVIAEALKAKMQALGFPADPVVTADLSRILRAPETVNYKDAKNPKPVTIIKEYPHDYDLDNITTPLSLNTVPDTSEHDQYFTKDNSALGAGVGYENTPHYAKFMMSNCMVMDEAMKTGGAGYKEMEWNQHLNLLAFCDDGAQYVHAVSVGHAGYNKVTTERKWQQKLAAKAQGSTGPTKCVSLGGYKPDLCAGCPHQNRITSPIQLGLPPTQGGYPKGWSGAKGWTFRLDDGDSKPVFPIMFEEVKVYDSENGFILAITHKIAGKPYTAEVPQVTLQHDPKQAAAMLSTAKMDFSSQQLKPLGELMMAWMNQIKKSGGIRPSVTSYGWVNQKKTGFAAGDALFWEDNTQEAVAVGDPLLRKIYQPKGDLAVWKKAAQALCDTGTIELQIGLASAFASPLIRFTPVKGVMLSLMSSESGTGKSTCLNVAQSVWGDPHAGINALNDTVNSVSKKLGMLNNLPAYWDELRMKKNVEDFIRLTFQIGQGKDKSRLTANSTMMATGTWNTLITCATNEPLNDHVAHMIQGTDAGAVRILEIKVPPIAKEREISQAKFTKTYRPTEENYGLAGAEYAKYLAANKDLVSDKVSDTIDKLAKHMQTSSAERFWVSTMASILVGAEIARTLGLVQFDLPGMTKRLVHLITTARVVAEETAGTGKESLAEVVNMYMTQHANGICYAKDEHGRVDHNSTIAPLPTQGIVGRVSKCVGLVHISQPAFRQWLYEIGHQPTTTLDGMKVELGMSRRRVKIGAVDESRKDAPQVRVFTFPMKNLGGEE